MNEADIEEFVAAYRQGATADFLQAKVNGTWGTLSTIPPCDPVAAERAGAQLKRMRATEIRWIRRARLRSAVRMRDVVVFAELPEKPQLVVDLDSGLALNLPQRLVNASDAALTSALGESRQ